jgi:hypothetical protein
MTLSRKFKKILITGAVIIGISAFALAGSARAAEFRGGDTIIIPENEVIDDDLFISGNRVEVNGTIRGDLFASGSYVTVNGTVEGSLFITGQTLVANGPVGGSLYSGGYALTIADGATIGRNTFFGGFSLDTEAESAVGRSLYAGGYQMVLNGQVADDVQVGSGALEVNGIVGGNVSGEVSPAEETAPSFFMPSFPGAVPILPPGLRISTGAEIGGLIDVVETPITPPDEGGGRSLIFRLGSALGVRAGEFITLLIVGGLLLRFWPASLEQPVAEARERPLPSAGWGCLVTAIVLVGIPLLALIIFLVAALGGLVTFGQLFNDLLSLGAASLGLFITVFTFVVSVVTKAVVAFLVGRLILQAAASQLEAGGWHNFAALALGALIYEILRAVPLFGWLIAVIVTLIGLGAITFALQKRLSPPAPAETAA